MSTSATHATGPRTAAGKAASSRNATRHGLLSAATVLGKHESAADWEDFCADIALSLAPSGRLEHALAERIALLHWRLARLARYEAEAIDAVLLDPVRDEAAEEAVFQRVFPPGLNTGWIPADVLAGIARGFGPGLDRNEQRTMPHPSPVLPPAPTVELIIRYEAHLSRELTRAMHQFERLQAIRADRAALAPAVPSAPELAHPAAPAAPSAPDSPATSVAPLAAMTSQCQAQPLPSGLSQRPDNMRMQNCETNSHGRAGQRNAVSVQVKPCPAAAETGGPTSSMHAKHIEDSILILTGGTSTPSS
jgi:hypothetical protein